MAGLKGSQHLKLSFKEIEVATKNFKTCIGKGGYGYVYIGELFVHEKHIMIAVKKLSERFGQGLKEFLTEIQLLTGQENPNLISLIGYCDDGKEKIIVYEYAERGSLDRHLNLNDSAQTTLTWLQRLKISVGAARGLDHLHRHVGKHQAIIHRDIKSANILIDKNWVAKISDLGLSKLSFAGLGRSSVISNVCGTQGYCEPEYFLTGIVKKESDVYSFGMVLFEVLSGRLCAIEYDDGILLSANLIKDYYNKNKLDEIIDPSIREQLNLYSLSKFAAVAYNCLDDRERRPTMHVVTKELEESLKIQMEYESGKEEKSKGSSNIEEFESDEYWKMMLPDDSDEIIKALNPSAHYSTRKELFMLLHKGFFFDNGERFFAIDDDGNKCEMISAKRFIKQKSKSPQQTQLSQLSPELHWRDESMRFPVTRRFPHIAELNIHCHISTSMLSLDTLYAANLVFSFQDYWGDTSSLHLNSSRWVWIKWKCEELRVSSAHVAERRKKDGGKFKSTLWHFINSHKNAYFDIVLNRLLGGEEDKLPYIIIHGLEFHPVEMAKKPHDGLDGEEGASTSKEYVDCRKKSPFDHLGMIHRSNMPWKYTTEEKEIYFHLCAGILIDNGQKWFFLCKSTGDKCHMLQAIDIFRKDSNYELIDTIPISESRFKEGIQLQNAPQYYFTCELESDMFSSQKLYACYLVFKFVNSYTTPAEGCLLEAYCELDKMKTSTVFAHLNSREPIPVIKPKKNTKFKELWNIPKTKGSGVPKYCFTGTHNWMQQRNDGWMEVILCEPFLDLEKGHSMNVKLRSLKGSFYGIIVQGIEFRPMERDN